ncbi:hypothetical protein GCM10022256_11510 [Frondihabitans peucedani]|uniref:Uncharacterized protein n=1 Tax=Frondihabitans peucedani TaxID=598626 RepID=A0ABP8E0Q9_9MICO
MFPEVVQERPAVLREPEARVEDRETELGAVHPDHLRDAGRDADHEALPLRVESLRVVKDPHSS